MNTIKDAYEDGVNHAIKLIEEGVLMGLTVEKSFEILKEARTKVMVLA